MDKLTRALQRQRDWPRPPLWLWMLLLCLPIALIYLPSAGNPGQFDDVYLFDNKPWQQQLLSSWQWLNLRWLPYASLAWVLQWDVPGATRLFWLHMGNLVVHLAVCVTLFVFLRRLFFVLLPQRDADGNQQDWLAFFAALVFGLHPVVVYGVGYLIQRSGEMATLFGLLALLAYLRGLEERRGWLLLVVPLYYLAVFSKEHVVMQPATFLLLAAVLPGGFRANVRRSWWVYAGCAAVALLVVFIKRGMLGTAYEIDAAQMLQELHIAHPYPLSVITQATLFFKYLGLWLLPDPAWLAVDMRIPLATSLATWYWLGALAFAGYCAAGIWLLRRPDGIAKITGFALLYPAVMFVTEFSVVRIQEPFVLYRSYLWLPGAMALFIWFARLRLRPLYRFATLAILALALVPLSLNRLHTFSHALLLWDDAAVLAEGQKELPGVYRILFNRANALQSVKLYDQALQGYDDVLALNPGFIHAYYGKGTAYLRKREPAAAIEQLDVVLKMDPKYREAYYARALAYQEMGNDAAARSDLVASCQLGKEVACIRAEGGKLVTPGS